MSDIQAIDVSLRFGEHPLLNRLNFSIYKNDKIAIIGRNGAGKSTLLKLLEGSIEPDSGRWVRSPHLHSATLQQAVPTHLSGTVREFVISALKQDYKNDYYRADRVLSQLDLPPDHLINQLSGGQVRRALLAQALVNDPDLLLLDEPTNHLDIDTIEWLEQFLQKLNKTVVFISHDRSFMQKVANRIFELDLGQLIDWPGSYQNFLKHKASALESDAKAEALFDKKLSQEEAWIRQGIKARRTRNEGRVRALESLREQRRARQSRQGQLNLTPQESLYAGKILMDIQDLTLREGDQTLVEHFSARLLRQDKVGIIGPNGSGKSTLIRCLLAQRAPDAGTIQPAADLKIAYFDQHRHQLDPRLNAMDNVAQGRSSIPLGGKEKSIYSYLQDFLFTPERARAPITALSGGEINRLLLAKVLSYPSQLLVLDEPTNDLDMETLELLEEFLVDYPGTLLLVSHDRSLLNHVVTSTWVFEGMGQVQEYIGNYDDYLRQSKKIATQIGPNTPSSKGGKVAPPSTPRRSSKLSYKEQRELDQLPQTIETLESSIADLQTRLADPRFYQQDPQRLAETQQQLGTLEHRLTDAYSRWGILEKKNQTST